MPACSSNLSTRSPLGISEGAVGLSRGYAHQLYGRKRVLLLFFCLSHYIIPRGTRAKVTSDNWPSEQKVNAFAVSKGPIRPPSQSLIPNVFNPIPTAAMEFGGVPMAPNKSLISSICSSVPGNQHSAPQLQRLEYHHVARSLYSDHSFRRPGYRLTNH